MPGQQCHYPPPTVATESGETPINPCDISGAHFKPDAYMEKLLKEKSLTELMDMETDITKRKDFAEHILLPGKGVNPSKKL